MSFYHGNEMYSDLKFTFTLRLIINVLVEYVAALVESSKGFPV